MAKTTMICPDYPEKGQETKSLSELSSEARTGPRYARLGTFRTGCKAQEVVETTLQVLEALQLQHQTIDVRESMGRLPGWMDRPLTRLTGKPRSGQRPLWSATSFSVLAKGVAWLVFGTVASALICRQSPVFWPLLPLTWMATVSGARSLQVSPIHYCAHTIFTGKEALDRWIAEIISATLLIQDFISYRVDHKLHHSVALATLKDVDLRFLVELGFRPGMSRQQLWNQLRKTIVSPRFHFLFLRARLKANFIKPSLARKVLAVAIQAMILTLVAMTHGWAAFLVGWLFPLTILYQASALLQFTSEHLWKHVLAGQRGRFALAKLTRARFFGEPVPPADLPCGQRLVAWSRWWARMLFIHLPTRVFVVPSDLVGHDWHHRHPKSKAWPNTIYERQQDLDAGCPGWPIPLEEVWGLGAALDDTFKVLSMAPSIDDAVEPLTKDELSDGLCGM